MIYWVTTRRHGYTIRRHLASFGRSMAAMVTPLSYGQLLREQRPRRGVYVLSDIERLHPQGIAQASELCDRLRALGATVLNRPAECLRRYDLLHGLRMRGTNAFDVYRASDGLTPKQFPVYLRLENDHKGNRSALLTDEAELRSAVAEQSRTRFWFRDEHGKRRLVRIGSRRRRELLVTEFCDTADAGGVYRKYGAFCVGGTIIARHMLFAQQWMVKGPDLFGAPELALELEYVQNNPHERQLAEIFRFARIDYGRIDYALLDGRIQVWEINTNPMICSPLDEIGTARLPVQKLFADRFARALQCLDEEHVTASSGVSAAAA